MTGKKKATVREAHYRENPVRKVQRTKYKNVNHPIQAIEHCRQNGNKTQRFLPGLRKQARYVAPEQGSLRCFSGLYVCHHGIKLA
jgi:hypothetical protein